MRGRGARRGPALVARAARQGAASKAGGRRGGVRRRRRLADQRHVRAPACAAEPAISGNGRTQSAPSARDQLAGHAPDHGGLLGFGDGAAALLRSSVMACGAVDSHAGHQDADRAGPGDVLHGGPNEPVGAWMPGIVGIGRRGHGDQPGRPPRRRRYRRRPGRYRRGPAAAGRCATTSTRSARTARPAAAPSAPVKVAGMCWATTIGQGKSAGSGVEQRLQRRRPAGRGADQHQAIARRRATALAAVAARAPSGEGSWHRAPPMRWRMRSRSRALDLILAPRRGADLGRAGSPATRRYAARSRPPAWRRNRRRRGAAPRASRRRPRRSATRPSPPGTGARP